MLEVYLLFNGEMVNGLAVLHTDDKELTVVNIVGPVDLDKLAQLEGQFGVPDLGIESQKRRTKNETSSEVSDESDCYKIFIVVVRHVSSRLRTVAHAKGDDFNSVVKMIEEFYRVKHVGIPFLAKAGMKVATTAARIKGGQARRIAEAGSIKLAVFEDQDIQRRFHEVSQLR